MRCNTTQQHRYQTSNKTLQYNTTQQYRYQTSNKTLYDITQHNNTYIKQVIKHSAI